MRTTRLSVVFLALLALLILSSPSQMSAQQKSSYEVFHQTVLGNGYAFLGKDSKPGNLQLAHYNRVEGNDESKITAISKGNQLVEVLFDTPKAKIAQPFQQAVGMAYAALLFTTKPSIFENKAEFEKNVDDFAEKMAAMWEKQGTQSMTHTGIQVEVKVTANRIVQRMWIKQ